MSITPGVSDGSLRGFPKECSLRSVIFE